MFKNCFLIFYVLQFINKYLTRMNNSDLFDLVRNIYSKYSFNPQTGEIKMPLRYLLELTYRCNLKCPFCYIKGNRIKDELSVENWFNIIDQLPAFSMITFVAGECLLKEGFVDIFKRAAQKYRKVTLISNGLNLSNNIFDVLIKHKLFLLSVSLDAIGSNHDKIRNHVGLYDKVISNLEYFVQKRGKRFSTKLDIKTCVLENNLDDIPKLYKEAQRMNADFFSLTFIRKQCLRQNSTLFEEFTEEFYKNTYPIELYFDMAHFKEIYRELESLQNKSKTVLRFAPRFNAKGDIDRIEKFFKLGNTPVNQIYKPCNIPMSALYITPDGNIYPCLSYNVGNVRDMKLKDAINTVKYKCFRKNLYYSKVFNACQMCCDGMIKNL